MIALALLHCVAALAASHPRVQSAGHRVAPDSALVAQARSQPDTAREALRRTLALAAADSQSASHLDDAEQLAQAWRVAWSDSFPLREVARFGSWSVAQRSAKVAADSLRRAGNIALGKEGLAAALRAWRESIRRCAAIGDSAGVASGLGNIGAGFYQSDEPDSADLYLKRARAMAERLGDHRTEGNAIGNLAAVQADRNEPRRAAELYARAAEVRLLTGDSRGAAADHNNLGLMAESLGDLDRARGAFDEALASNRAAGRDEPAAVNLINLGNLASLQGNYPRAAARFHQALALLHVHGNRVDMAGALRALGLLELQRGDFGKALQRFSEALVVYRETGPLTDEIDVRRDIAIAHAAMGNLQGALIQLGRAEQLVSGDASAPQQSGDLALARADLAMRFNTYPEAEREYLRAGQFFQKAADGRGQAEAESGLGELLLLRKDYSGALTRIELALHSEETLGDPRAIALTRLLLGYLQVQRDDSGAARASLDAAIASLHTLGDVAGEAAALGTLGQLAAREDRPIAAESLFRRALARLGSAPAPAVAWELHAGLGDALRSRGERDESARELRAAVGEVERMSGTLPMEQRRAAFQADKWEVYAQLARVELARGDVSAAFAASERQRARELLDLLARGRVAPHSDAKVNDTLAVREQDLRRQIDVLTGELEKRQGSGSLRGPLATDASSGAVREALGQAQRQYAELLQQLREKSPEYSAAVTGEIAPVRKVMAQLGHDQALLEYLVGDSSSLVFVVTSDTVAAIQLSVARHELAKLVDFSRGVLLRPAAGSESELWRTPLRRLDQYLIEPIERSGLLNGKSELIIAPHAELHYLPFAALLGAQSASEYLVQRYQLTYVPSASVWLRLRERVRPTGSGVLALAPRVDALPGSGAEVAAIGKAFGSRARVLVGAQASKRALREAAPLESIIHFATYGVLNKDNPLFSFVELAPEGGGDGRLEVHEVFGLQLNARLVVLSACQTALGAGEQEDVPSGDDWVGLVQAFHSAGAANVMAALWPVDDRATADLMGEFYAALASGRSESRALAEAQRQMLRNKATAHPFYWAGFTMSGGQ